MEFPVDCLEPPLLDMGVDLRGGDIRVAHHRHDVREREGLESERAERVAQVMEDDWIVLSRRRPNPARSSAA